MKPIPFAEPLFTFSEVLTVTGVGENWLRTFIQRDKDGLIGSKHRTGRLMFSLRDIVAVTVLAGLNTGLRVAPAAGWEVVKAVEPIIAAAQDVSSEHIHVGFDDNGNALVWTLKGGVVVTWNDAADENQVAVYHANQGPHIVFPLQAILSPVGEATKLAQEWAEQEVAQ